MLQSDVADRPLPAPRSRHRGSPNPARAIGEERGRYAPPMYLDRGPNIGMFVVAVVLIAISVTLIICSRPLSRYVMKLELPRYSQFRSFRSQLGVVLISVAWIIVGVVMLYPAIFIRLND
jgi:hypothetical protein